jgi:RNA polymerase sigma-70 factor (ECF subfamily)
MLVDDFDEFYATSYRRLVGQVYAMVGDLAEAEDAVQEAYCRAWQRRAKLRDYDSPEAWVRTVAYRIAVSSWRRAAHRLLAHQRHGDARQLPGPGPEHLTMVDALRRIPTDQRRVIVLHHLVGLSVEEISQEVDIPVGTVKSRLARGRRALAAQFPEFSAAEPPSAGRGALRHA